MKKHLFYVAFALLAAALSLGWSFIQALPVGVDMSQAAQAFLAALSDEQRAIAVLEYDTPQRVGWHFVPKDQRKGMQIKDMDPRQREAAHDLLRSALSDIGYDKAVKIMKLEQLLRELESGRRNGAIRDPERYYVTLFGQPGEDSRWGMSFEGHHLSLNFVVDAGKVIASTPAFFGANPGIVKKELPGGPKEGLRVLAREETRAFDLVRSLSDEQRRTAVIAEKALREIRAAGEPQPPQDQPAGLPLAQMSQAQTKMLKQLVGAYLENMPAELRKARIDAIVAAGPENVHFAWAGPTEPGIGHYYRVQGPTFLIEFVNTQPDAAGNPANHIHCVWRDMRGDFAIPVEEG